MYTSRPQSPARRLRYLLTVVLQDAGRPMTLLELVAVVAALGVDVPGRPSKAISDGLRWERRKGRVVHLGRGIYGPGRMPRSTRHWIRAQVRTWLDADPGAASSDLSSV